MPILDLRPRVRGPAIHTARERGCIASAHAICKRRDRPRARARPCFIWRSPCQVADSLFDEIHVKEKVFLTPHAKKGLRTSVRIKDEPITFPAISLRIYVHTKNQSMIPTRSSLTDRQLPAKWVTQNLLQRSPKLASNWQVRIRIPLRYGKGGT